MNLLWRPLAQEDRDRIFDYVVQDNPQAAIDLDELFKKKANAIAEQPKLFKAGRIKGTREAVVHPNYVLVYQVSTDTVTILRVLHTAQAWPVR